MVIVTVRTCAVVMLAGFGVTVTVGVVATAVTVTATKPEMLLELLLSPL
jgi:hypothetical protein